MILTRSFCFPGFYHINYVLTTFLFYLCIYFGFTLRGEGGDHCGGGGWGWWLVEVVGSVANGYVVYL